MIGITVCNLAFIYSNNQSILYNATTLDSMQKLHTLAYHFCREDVAQKECIAIYVNTKQKFSDILTKCLPMRKG